MNQFVWSLAAVSLITVQNTKHIYLNRILWYRLIILPRSPRTLFLLWSWWTELTLGSVPREISSWFVTAVDGREKNLPSLFRVGKMLETAKVTNRWELVSVPCRHRSSLPSATNSWFVIPSNLFYNLWKKSNQLIFLFFFWLMVLGDSVRHQWIRWNGIVGWADIGLIKINNHLIGC